MTPTEQAPSPSPEAPATEPSEVSEATASRDASSAQETPETPGTSASASDTGSAGGERGDVPEQQPKPADSKAAQPPAPTPSGAALGKNVLLFLGIMTTLALGYSYLGKEVPPAAVPPIRWATGQTVDVEITLVKTDAQNLACASASEVSGRHCTFESATATWSKGKVGDDTTTLKPYTTTNRVQFLASSLWSQPALAQDKLPASRFTVKCKYTVEGKVKSPQVRWDEAGAWNPQTSEWYAGYVSACTLLPSGG